jgi:hypothetical protein
MKTGFKDPIAKKVKEKTMKSPWNFEQPPYDERTSCFINAGSHQGVGYRQPVGSHGGPKSSDMIPKGRVNTLKDDNVPKKNLKVEIDV